MKKTITFLIIYIIGFQYLAAQCYQLVWADEFNGTALDLTKWTVELPNTSPGNAELQQYTDRPQNIQVGAGSLKIIALQESFMGFNYTSGRINTKYQGDWLYGKMEARIKLPTAVGMWPAFWMLPTDNVYGIWPKSGEMDIMELIGIQPNVTYGTIHTHNGNNVQTFGTWYTLPSGIFSDSFHNFSMEWEPNRVKIFLDGILYFDKTNMDLAPYPWVFDQRFHLILNLAVGGSWGGNPTASTIFPQTMEVDYVRVYQKTNQIAITGKLLVEPNATNQIYSVPSVPGTTYFWSVTGSGNTIISGQNSNQIVVNFANTSGIVSVLMTDTCMQSATAVANITVTPNLWSNFNFEQNYMYWDTRPAYNPAVDFNIATTNVAEGLKAACVQVNTAGANPWDIQLSKTNLNLTNGTNYTLSFKAKADANKTIPVSFIRSDNYATIAGRTINLTTNWQTYSMNFTPTLTVANAMFNLDVAGSTGTYCFDDFLFARTQNLATAAIESEDFEVSVFPNPTKNWISIQLNNRDLKIQIFDLQGRIVFENETVPENINVTNFQNGIYILKIGKSVTKIIKGNL
jgi:beta-glucanase (GH16 family)